MTSILKTHAEPHGGKHPDSFVVFEYVYRDASNYKAYGEILLTGMFCPDLEALVSDRLIDGMWFLPARAGIPSLHDALYSYSDGPTADDHPWHEFVALRPAEAADIEGLVPQGTVGDFIAQLAS